MPTIYLRARNLLGALCLIVVVVGTFWFALGGAPSLLEGLIGSLSFGVILGLLQGRRHGFQLGLATGLVAALAVGLAVGFLLTVSPTRVANPGFLFAPSDLPVVVLAMNLAISFVRLRAGQPWRPRWADCISMGATNGTLVNGMSILHAVVGGTDLTLGFFFRSITELLVGAAWGATTAPVAEYLAFWLKPRLRVFVALLPYLRDVSVPFGGFAFGYITVIFLFASVVGATWRADPAGAYQGLGANPTFGSFFYLSVQTITGIGFASVTPHSAYAKSLASVEVIVGVLWNTVFVATFIAYLQPRFQQLRRSLHDDPSANHTNDRP